MTIDEAEAQPARFFDQCETQLTLEGDVLFDFNSDGLRDDAVAPLMRLADLLREHQSEQLVVRIVGHSDPRGTERFNDLLSLSRAKRVREFLVSQGAIARSATRIEGRGKREPLHAVDAPEELQRLSRRVDISVVCPGGGTSLLPTSTPSSAPAAPPIPAPDAGEAVAPATEGVATDAPSDAPAAPSRVTPRRGTSRASVRAAPAQQAASTTPAPTAAPRAPAKKAAPPAPPAPGTKVVRPPSARRGSSK